LQGDDLLFSLLVTSTSLQELTISCQHGCSDAAMSALARYPGGSPLTNFIMRRYSVMSEGLFACTICNSLYSVR
jgi:hypothetical protein